MFMGITALLEENRGFCKTLAGIAIPVTIQNLANSLINITESSMIGRLGVLNIAAIGLAGKMLFVLNLLLYGIGSGSAIFSAQYWGKRDLANLKHVVSACLTMGILTAFLFSIIVYCFPGFIISFFTNDRDVNSLGVKYLQTVSLSYCAVAVSVSLTFMLRSIGKAHVTMFTSLGAFAINILLDWLLIFGHWGFPALGIYGAALATLIAKSLECIANIICIQIFRYPIVVSLKDLTGISSEYLKKILQTVIPFVGNDLFWGIGITMYFVIYGHMGVMALVVMTITNCVEQLIQIIFLSVANASAILIGNKIGADRQFNFRQYSKKFLVISFVLGIFSMIILLISIPVILNIYELDYETSNFVYWNLIFLSLVFPIKSINYMYIDGVFRSNGDTKFIIIFDAGITWLVSLPLTVFLGLVMYMNINIVYLGVLSIEIFKQIAGIKRYCSNKWVRNFLC